jgi:hypothetical protein
LSGWQQPLALRRLLHRREQLVTFVTNRVNRSMALPYCQRLPDARSLRLRMANQCRSLSNVDVVPFPPIAGT